MYFRCIVNPEFGRLVHTLRARFNYELFNFESTQDEDRSKVNFDSVNARGL